MMILLIFAHFDECRHIKRGDKFQTFCVAKWHIFDLCCFWFIAQWLGALIWSRISWGSFLRTFVNKLLNCWILRFYSVLIGLHCFHLRFMNPDISSLQLASFLFQCVKVVTKMIYLVMICLKLSGSANSSQTPIMPSFMQKSVEQDWKSFQSLPVSIILVYCIGSNRC
jgi:hypothetical protein